MIYAVIDTNVLVSAFITKNQDSSTAKVWSAMLNFDIIPMYSEEIIEEYKDVLHRKKFDIPEQLIKDALNHIMVNGVRGERVLSDDFFPDPKDVVFYEVAMSRSPHRPMVRPSKRRFSRQMVSRSARVWVGWQ